MPFLSLALFPHSVGVWAQALLKTLIQHTVSAGGSLVLFQGNRGLVNSEQTTHGQYVCSEIIIPFYSVGIQIFL